jgi:hypothetical protein
MKVRKFISPRLSMQVASRLAMWYEPWTKDPDPNFGNVGSLWLGTYKNNLRQFPQQTDIPDGAHINSAGELGPEGGTVGKLYTFYDFDIPIKGRGYRGPNITVNSGQSVSIKIKTVVSSGDVIASMIDFSDESQVDYLQENMDTTVYYTNKTTDKQIFRIILTPVNVKKESSPTATIEVYENKNSFSPGFNHDVVKESMTNGLLSGMTEIANWAQDEYENVSVKFVCGHHLGDITFEQKINITSDQSMHIVFPHQFNNNPIDVAVTATVRNVHGKFNGFRFDSAITAAAMVQNPVKSTTTNTAARGDVSLGSTGSTVTDVATPASSAY